MEYTYFEEPEYPFLHRLKKCLVSYVNFSLALLVTLLTVRILEFLLIAQSNDLPSDFGTVLWYSFTLDLLFFLKLLPLAFVPFILFYFSSKNKRVSFIGFGIIGTIITVVFLLLIKYYTVALVPLGADLFGYSFKEITETAGTGGSVDIIGVVMVIMPIALFWTLLFVTYKRQFVKQSVSFILMAAGMMLVYLKVSALPRVTAFKTDFSYNLAINKGAFFAERSYKYFTDDEPEVDIYALNYYDEEDSNGAGIANFKFLDPDYPFFRKEETPDVLSNFFNIDPETPPNIVFIQVEGLGRAYSGPNAYLGSFTPFLDALAHRSLYFENFLASQGRTFAALPSILGSLPFGKKGFLDLDKRMPKHLSLPQILKYNGYGTRFYSGFDLTFDNEDEFVKRQGTDIVITENEFEHSFVKSPPESGGFTWGYADMDLMKKTIQTEVKNQNEPFLTYIQTVSMHTPYTIPGQQKYFEKFEKRLDELGFDKSKKDSYRQYKDIYSTILYGDDAIKYFIGEYSKLPSFKNTIFVITGDHRLPEIPMTTKIERYHVPLIIYSPMLKRKANIRSVSSHFDITPSLLAFLGQNYKLNVPSSVSWVGAGLDTVRSFRNVHKYPLKQTKNDLHNFISGKYFLDLDNVYEVNDNMQLIPLDDRARLNELKTDFNQWKAKNDRLDRELKLIPDSIYNRFR